MTKFIDIAVEKVNNYYDIMFSDGDIVLTNGIDTSIYISLLCPRRALPSEVATPQERRGWVGNLQLYDNLFELGSKLWLLSQARASDVNLQRAKQFSDEALNWMIDDGIATKITIDTQYINTGLLISGTIEMKNKELFDFSVNI